MISQMSTGIQVLGAMTPDDPPRPIVCPIPNPFWVVGHCPSCAAPLVENEYYSGGRGFYLLTQCWNALLEPAQCDVWNLTAVGNGSADRSAI